MENLDCHRVRNDIDRLFAGELAEDDRAVIDAHLERCSDCREHHALVSQIASRPAPETDERDLLAMRRAVLGTIQSERGAERTSFFTRLPHAAALALVTGGAVLLAAGWFVGRTTAPEAVAARRGGMANPDLVLARQIQSVARENTGLADVENSPYRYANVRIEPQPEGRIRLGFDVSRHLELTLLKSDPLVTEVLVQSVLDSGSIGTRLRAIDEAGNILDPRVRGALIKAMLHDENLGVRLQAQSRLIERAGDAGIADALLTVLENEESVQMRLVAIDYLTRSRVDPRRLREAVEAGEPEGRGAVRVKARDYVVSF